MACTTLSDQEQRVFDLLVLRVSNGESIPKGLAAQFIDVLRAHIPDMDVWNSGWEELASVMNFGPSVHPGDLYLHAMDLLYREPSGEEILEAFSEAFLCWKELPGNMCLAIKIRSSAGSDAWVGIDVSEAVEYSFACTGTSPEDLEAKFRARGDVFPHEILEDLPSGVRDIFTEEQILAGVKNHLASRGSS